MIEETPTITIAAATQYRGEELQDKGKRKIGGAYA